MLFESSLYSIKSTLPLLSGQSACLSTVLPITVGHRTLADQNLFMSDKIPSVVRHDVRKVNHFTVTMNKIKPFGFSDVQPKFCFVRP